MYRSMGLIMTCCGRHDIYEVLFYLVKEGELVRIRRVSSISQPSLLISSVVLVLQHLG